MTVASVSPAALAVAADTATATAQTVNPGESTAIPTGLRAAATALTAGLQSDYGRLPMHFEPNVGQHDAAVKFSARGQGYQLLLMPEEAMLVLSHGNAPAAGSAKPAVAERAPVAEPQRPQADRRSAAADRTAPSVVRMRLEGATRQPAPTLEGLEPQPGVSNYLRGNDPTQWRTAVPHYARVKYSAVYPGIDLVYYGNPQQLEYDFVLAPGADPNQIALTFEGAEGIRLAENGDLILSVGGGELVQQAPRIYQEIAGERRVVDGRYRLKTDTTAPDALPRIGFEVASYQADVALVIDPVLAYSTFAGGSGEDGYGGSIAVDAAGNVYVTGSTTSRNFPILNAFDRSTNGDRDAFILKLNGRGQLVYSTYFGGSGDDDGNAIAVNNAGNAYITGWTGSVDIPTFNAFDRTGDYGDAFVVKLNVAGNALVYATYLGGREGDGGEGIAVDSAGYAYITGTTRSRDFPIRNAFDRSLGGSADAFVVKLNRAGNALIYATYLGGGGFEWGEDIAVDRAGQAYVTGLTNSTDFPTSRNAFDKSLNGGQDVFVVKLNAKGNALAYATYLGGRGSDESTGIALDISGNAYITGTTYSSDFPVTPSAFDRTYNLAGGFVTKINTKGTALVYSTYFDGRGAGIAVDTGGNAHITGETGSGIPIKNAIFPEPQACCGFEAFATKLNASGSALHYSTYLGGNYRQDGFGIAVDTTGNAYIMGKTESRDFPTRNAFQPVHGGAYTDLFIMKISDSQ